jgi:hypothetical protein
MLAQGKPKITKEIDQDCIDVSESIVDDFINEESLRGSLSHKIYDQILKGD